MEKRIRLILPITIHQIVIPLLQRINSNTHTTATQCLSSPNNFLPPFLELEERKDDEQDDKVDEISLMNGNQREKEEEKSFFNSDALSKRELSRAAADVDVTIYQKAESETRSEESEILKISYFFLYNLQFTLFISNYRQTMSFLCVYNKK